MSISDMNPSFTKVGDQSKERSYRDRIKTKNAADRYLRRNSSRDRAERRMVKKALRLLPPGARLLDVPCGNGRMAKVAAAYGCQTTCADLSEHVLDNARKAFDEAGFNGTFDVQDLEHLTYADGAFDAVLSFRYFHHLPSHEIRDQVSCELVRVAKTHVFVSYLHPFSFTSIKRRLRHLCGGKRSKQHTTTRRQLLEYFEKQGFVVAIEIKQFSFLRSLHLACFARKATGDSD